MLLVRDGLVLATGVMEGLLSLHDVLPVAPETLGAWRSPSRIATRFGMASADIARVTATS